MHVGVLAPSPADVGYPDGRRIAVGEAEQQPFAVPGFRVDPAGLAAVVSEPVGGLQLEPGAAALFFVGGDPVAARGAYGGETEQGAGGVAQRLGAVLADVDADRLGMKVTAGTAAPGRTGDCSFLTGFGGRQGDADHLVTGALVVDDGAGAEFADADEPGPLDVIAFAASGQAGNVGGERQAGEGVAGQEAF